MTFHTRMDWTGRDRAAPCSGCGPLLFQLRGRLLLAFGRWRLGHGLARGLGRLRRDDWLLLGCGLDGRRRLRGWLCARGGLIGFVWCHRCYLPERVSLVDMDGGLRGRGSKQVRNESTNA